MSINEMKHTYDEEEKRVQKGEKRNCRHSFDIKGIMGWAFLNCTNDESIDTNTLCLMTQEISLLWRWEQPYFGMCITWAFPSQQCNCSAVLVA